MSGRRPTAGGLMLTAVEAVHTAGRLTSGGARPSAGDGGKAAGTLGALPRASSTG